MSLDIVAGHLFIAEDPFLYVSFWSFIFSCAVAWVVSTLSEPWPREKIAPLLWQKELPSNQSEEQ